jgi:hypothetical protein
MSDLREKYEKRLATGTIVVPRNGEAIKECFYGNLTVLDTKASALMTFDGILIAVASFTVQTGGVFEKQPIVPLIVIITALIAAGLCLFVAQISYRFLGKVIIKPGASDTLDYTAEIKALHGAVDRRTFYYRTAWYLSLIAIALFLAMFLLTLRTYS